MYDTFELHGVTIKSGDLICTRDGNQHALFSKAYEALGLIIPGPIDHVAIYVGPGPRFIEAGPFGVIDYELPGSTWDSAAIFRRRMIADTIYGVADPVSGRGFSPALENAIRYEVTLFCNTQAADRKPYNVNFFDSANQQAFYCSQLAYAAYKRHGINLNVGKGIPELPGIGSIIFPTEIWHACQQTRIE
ncbi:MAG: hypothetical protein SH847_06915 [Roseiflexaceae bacterium]|nr:hypothetical protein [Roseiflexaceae bacterium]